MLQNLPNILWTTLIAILITTLVVVLIAFSTNISPDLLEGTLFSWKLIRQMWFLLVLAAIPSLLIFQYGFFLYFVDKSRKLTSLDGRYESLIYVNLPQNRKRKIQREQLKSDIEYYYGFQGVLLDFFLPAALTLLVGITLAFVVSGRASPILSATYDDNMRGVIFGASGAYVYVLITLFSRYFQRDLTPGMAYWTVASLCLGPILGGLTQAIIGPTPPKQDGSGATGIPLAYSTLYFFAGLSSREVVGLIKVTARRMWSGTASTESASTDVPLTRIRGISAEKAERLQEEGIGSATALACSNPMQLIRNTPFSMAEIVCWMDQALLYLFLPETSVAVLRAEGINGAIDVAYYRDIYSGSAQADQEFHQRTEDLATKLKMDGNSFRDVIQRLYYDTQLSLVWLLSDLDGNDTSVLPIDKRRIVPIQTNVVAQFDGILANVAPGFVTNAVGPPGIALLENYFSRSGVVCTNPVAPNQPCVLTRTDPFLVPATGEAFLRIIVSFDPRGSWLLRVKIGSGNPIVQDPPIEQVIGPQTTTDGWAEFLFDLSEHHAGQTVSIALENDTDQGTWNAAFWGLVRIETD
ncbi:MAG: uncharacterized protein JWM11_6808 [Planctomycetaceae bacterium]|nr:uncharacterized protein [Planctomycetaceae bacterium]